MTLRKLPGFTLIELIVVIGIIAILTGITVIAVNPARQFAQARNAQRSSDVVEELNSIHQYAAENGSFPSVLTSIPITSGSSSAAVAICVTASTQYTVACPTGGVVLDTALVSNYLSKLPRDPSQASNTQDTGYTIVRNGTSSTTTGFTVAAPQAELSKTISATR